ncbi:MAG: phosphohydrolase [Clostridia bacterium]|nr:phosphohydrolase [Clostridia bacterium]
MYRYVKEIVMSYILTYKKIEFYPLDPKTEDIDIEDIAHALSLLCRANGHFKHFYSVGIHSLNCAKEALARGYSDRVVLGCLLHDGSEAYLADITRPVKKHLQKYLEIEDVLQGKIFEKWIPGLNKDELKLIFEIDDAILYYEFTTLFGESIFDYVPELKSEPVFDYVEPRLIENEFLDTFKHLCERIG